MLTYKIEIFNSNNSKINSYEVATRAFTPQYLFDLVLKEIIDTGLELMKIQIWADVGNREVSFWVYSTGHIILHAMPPEVFDLHIDKLETLKNHPKLREAIS